MDFYKREFHFLLASITKLENLSHWREESSQEILKKMNILDERKLRKSYCIGALSLENAGASWEHRLVGAQTWPLTSVICSIMVLTSTFHPPSCLVGFPNEWESQVCAPHRACHFSPILAKGGFRLEHGLVLTSTPLHFRHNVMWLTGKNRTSGFHFSMHFRPKPIYLT